MVAKLLCSSCRDQEMSTVYPNDSKPSVLDASMIGYCGDGVWIVLSFSPLLKINGLNH